MQCNRSKWSKWELLSSLMIATTVFTAIVAGQTGTWTSRSPISFARYFTESAVLNGVLYTTGGWNGCTPYNNVEAYDAYTDTWSPRAAMQSARGYHAVGELGGKLYAVGGAVGCGAGIANVEAYDASSDTWTQVAPLPQARYGHSVATANGKLYAIGGSFPTQLAAMTEYDPTLNTWTERTPMPEPRYNAGVAVVNGIIYVIGGGNYSNGALSSVIAYDPATDTWSAKAPLPLGRQSLDATVLDGKIYAVGGSGDCTSLERVDVYDPIADNWTAGTPLPAKRLDFGIATLNNSIFVVGGYELIVCGYVDERPVSTVFQFTPDGDEVAPSVSLSSPSDGATYLIGETVNANFECEDNAGGSGIASCTGTVANGSPIDTFTAGTKTFSVVAEDNEGNSTTETVTYRVVFNFSGFRQPVEDLPSVNVAKAGSSIPIKFSLFGYHGLGIFAEGYPASGQVACDANEPGPVIEETVNSGGSSLTYSSTADQYSYIWKTNRAWNGTCRILVVRLSDGSDHFAKFRFR